MVFGCAQPNPPAISQNQDDVLEAVVRYEIARHKLPSNQVYFISVNGGGSLDVFLARLKDIPSVRNYSKAKPTPPNNELVDIQTGQKGIAITAGPVSFDEDGTATVSVSYYIASLAAEGFIYTIKWQNGKWVVINTTTTWVS